MIWIIDRPLQSTRRARIEPSRNVLQFLWRSSSRHQIGICLLSIVVAVLSMAPLELQRRVVDDVLTQDTVSDAALKTLAALGAVYFAIIVFHGATKFALRMYRGWVSESVVRFARERLTGVHGRRVAAGQDQESGRAVSVIGTEIEHVSGFVGDGLSEPLVQGGILVSILSYMFYVEPIVAAFSLLFLIPQALLVPWLQKWVNRLFERRTEMLRDFSDELTDGESGLEDTVNRSIEIEEPLKRCLDAIYTNRMRLYVFTFGIKGVTNFLNSLAPVSVLLVGGYCVLHGDTTLGVVVAFISGFERLASPLRQLLTYYREAALANVKYQMISKWI
jgi:ABC-type multidrug transport system fused ATPase/permease subunit